MAHKFSLSDSAIAVFAVILVITFSLQIHLNRTLTPKVLAQTVQKIMCGETEMPAGTVLACVPPGRTEARGSDVYKCNTTCSAWELVPKVNPTDNGACCVDDGTQSTCNDSIYVQATCLNGNPSTGLSAGVKWFDSRNACYSARAQNGGRCVAVASSAASSTSTASTASATSSYASVAGQSACGDYRVDKPNSYGVMEECDWGPRNSDTLQDSCRRNCKNPRCGDGVIDPSLNEECDDGDLGNGASGWGNCDATCKLYPKETESLYFMITQALMGLPSFETLTTATSSVASEGGSAALFDWNALFFPVSPLAW